MVTDRRSTVMDSRHAPLNLASPETHGMGQWPLLPFGAPICQAMFLWLLEEGVAKDNTDAVSSGELWKKHITKEDHRPNRDGLPLPDPFPTTPIWEEEEDKNSADLQPLPLPPSLFTQTWLPRKCLRLAPRHLTTPWTEGHVPQCVCNLVSVNKPSWCFCLQVLTSLSFQKRQQVS